MAQPRCCPSRFRFPENCPSQAWLENTHTPSTGKVESQHQKLRQGMLAGETEVKEKQDNTKGRDGVSQERGKCRKESVSEWREGTPSRDLSEPTAEEITNTHSVP